MARKSGGTDTSRIRVTDQNWHQSHTFMVKAMMDGKRDGLQKRQLVVYMQCAAISVTPVRITIGFIPVRTLDQGCASCDRWF